MGRKKLAKGLKRKQLSVYLPPEEAAWVDSRRGTLSASSYVTALVSRVRVLATKSATGKRVSAFVPDLDGVDVKKVVREIAGLPPKVAPARPPLDGWVTKPEEPKP